MLRMTSFVSAIFTATAIIDPTIFTVTIFIAAVFVAVIFVAVIRETTRFFCLKLIAAIGDVVFAGGVVGGKVVARKNIVAKRIVAKSGIGELGRRGHRGGFSGRGGGIRHIGIGPLFELTLADGREIVGHGFLFVKADLAGVGADETFIEDAAGELVEAFVLESAQHAGADLRGVGDGIEFDAAQLALLAKFFSEGAHVQLLLSFRPQSS
jgi:hypothetical protein